MHILKYMVAVGVGVCCIAGNMCIIHIQMLRYKNHYHFINAAKSKDVQTKNEQLFC